MIAGDEPTTSYFDIRWLLPGAGMRQDFVLLREADRAARQVLNRAQHRDVYLACAPRVRRDGKLRGRLEYIEHCWAVWCDLDTFAGLVKLRAFQPLPSLVVFTGREHGAHAWWALSHPISTAWAKQANKRLALALDGDMKSTDAAHILRPVGTVNHKYSPPRPVTCTRLTSDTVTLREVVGGLPDPTERVKTRSTWSRRTGPAAEVLGGLIAHVRRAPDGNGNCCLHWASCRAAEHVEAGRVDRDEAWGLLLDAAIDIGLEPPKAQRTIASAMRTT